jgi:ribonuclease D
VIDTDEKLAELLRTVCDAPWLAVDTEADSLHSHPEKLCLIQIGIPGLDELVDPLAKINLQPLWELLGSREIMLHGADYDLRLFAKHHQFSPTCIFDTMIASRLLGIRQFGLSNLVELFIGVKLEKGPQKSDWSKRPLTDRMMQYARNDTHHLFTITDNLKRQLTEKGRLDWCRESCDRSLADNSKYVPPDPDRVWRIKGSAKLQRAEMAVLRELWQWREEEAVAADKPPFFVMKHDHLISISGDSVAGRDWKQIIPRRFSPRRTNSLKDAVARGLSCPEAAYPEKFRGKPYHPTEVEKKQFTNLRAIRDGHAEKLEIDATLIASRETLELLSRKESDDAWQNLMNWQRELLQN